MKTKEIFLLLGNSLSKNPSNLTTLTFIEESTLNQNNLMLSYQTLRIDQGSMINV